ncbi:MAG: bifunctional [glutamate--ammonia ligase]-adenylyl-L-tyrosine phosphorylase/[glutamate--ammonia-ligase] adenylyltransferase [Proteobacteria bacterium]|nr:bifunctional [glutamate--ammonia ligase]-adenylyl-L-tyrosine phosphorylase/[glutamate--ammonia-ligase] adenylyltransferase [Pseudomonadota bacterium]
MTSDITPPVELLSQVPHSLHSIVENFWHDWCVSCEQKNIDRSQIDQSQNLPLSVLGKIWACSDFVARNCVRYPEMIYSLNTEGFESTRSIELYRELVAQVVVAAKDEDALMSALRVLRQQEMVRIAWRDLNALTDMKMILQELTDLAEAMVAVTLQHLQLQNAEKFGMPLDESGEPQALLVFAMGKMGGGELNFSSDIDLIFSFSEDGETTGRRKTSHYEFYLAVIHKLVKLLDEVTADGFVYRVDTRLRPFGEDGPMAMSFSGVEQYYQLQGRDWERYAMIKARLITGRDNDKRYLQSMLTPFVYRRYLDFSMLDSIREMKAMISAQMKRKRMTNNVKLGPGGIREIEFIGQTLQLIRAGREPELRERSIIKVLTILAEKNYLKKQEVEQLIQAYWFLRKLENRLQIQNDKQTHTLPDDEISQQRLCVAMQMRDWDELLEQLSFHQKAVDDVFQNLIASDNEEPDNGVSSFALFWSDVDASDDDNEGVRHYLESTGYSSADEVIKLLIDLRSRSQVKHLTGDTARLLSRLMESLIEKIADYPDQAVLFDRICRIIKALAGRKVYISLLSEYPTIQLQMLTLCSASEWFTERLIKYPILLDSLLSTAEAFRRQYDIRQLLALELKRIEGESGGDADLELQMDRMRQFKRQTVFTVAMLDIFYEEPVEIVSDRLTELADVLLEKILSFAWQAMVVKYGEPGCVIDGEMVQPSMSIVAYGKMGGNELGYGSDLDIIFLHNSQGEKQVTAGEKSIDNQSFFARVAQRVIHFLDTRTYSGILYEADTRLRADGQSGLMVSSISAFERYQQEKAWTWEHQALIRARFVTGDALIEQEFDRIRSSVLRQHRDIEPLLQEVVVMREKMRNHLSNNSANFDFKQDAGGLVDIEFMTQAGILIHAEQCSDCIKHTATLELINELNIIGWYEAGEAEDIGNAYRYFRKLKNWQNLECEADVSDVSLHRDNVVAVWNRLMPEKEKF